jgi:hypothetical protein
MVQEEVNFRVTPGKSFVECRFVFRNTGSARDVLMGFPEYAVSEDGLGDDVSIHEFRSWVRGVETPVRREAGLPAPGARQYRFWWTWPVSFREGETVEVRNSYWVRHTFVSNGEEHTGYVLTTGEPWKGPIGEARVTFRLEGVFPGELERVYPGNYRFDGDDIVWEWEDFEPGADIEVVFSSRHSLFERGLDQAIRESPDPDPEAERLAWDVLSCGMNRDNANALSALRRLAALPGLSDRVAAALRPLEARFRFLLGDRLFGRDVWEDLVESGDALAEDFYFLGCAYEADRDRSKLAALYRLLRELVPPEGVYGSPATPQRDSLAVVRRWLACKVPGEAKGEFVTSAHPPSLRGVTVEPENPAAPVAYILTPTVRDEGADLGRVHVKVWYVEEGAERVIIEEDFAQWLSDGREARPRLQVTPPWPFATIYYQVRARDSQGSLLDTGPVEHCFDKVRDWTYVSAAKRLGSEGPALVEIRFHGDGGRRLAADVAGALEKAVERLDQKLSLIPSNPVMASFYETTEDEPPRELAAVNPTYPWYVVGGGRSITPGRVTTDILSRVLATCLGPGWVPDPGSEPGWLRQGVTDYLLDVDSTEARMVKFLHDRGPDVFLSFLDEVGRGGGDQDDILFRCYSMTADELRKASEPLGLGPFVRRTAPAAGLTLCLALAVLALRRSDRRRSGATRL